MNGLFLQGGGAKGAFQAGALYALHEKGIRFQFVTGTSIGAINGYYLYTGNLEALKELYTGHIENKEHQENKEHTKPIKLNKVIENEYLINKLGKLKTVASSVQEFLINYVYINGCVPEEKIVNLNEFSKEKAIEFVKYSSLLPYAVEGEQVIDDLESFIKSFDSSKIFDAFKVMVTKGIYNGYSLDGGILNNTFLKPFVDENRHESLDKIYMLPLSNSFQVPEYIYEKYNKEQIIVIKRQKEFMPYHTLNFKEEFLKELFYEGYQAVNNK